MNAIIMAGGKSSRLRPITKYLPKCMLKLDIHEDTTIIDAQIKMLSFFGVKNIIVITGFGADKLKDHIEKQSFKANIKFVNNPKFEETYPAYAFWLAKKYLKETFIYLNGDVVFHPNVLETIIKSKKNSITAIKKTNWDKEEVNVILDKNNQVLEIGKHISKTLSAGEFVGVTKIGNDFLDKFVSALNYFQEKGEHKKFAADAINLAIQNWDGKLYIEDISKFPVIEIDTITDYNEAKKLWKKIKNDFKNINNN